MKTILALVFAAFVLATGMTTAPGGAFAFYPDGHDSFTGGGRPGPSGQ